MALAATAAAAAPVAAARPTVTTALHVMEGNGFIRNKRGVVIMRDRPALEEFAGDAYGYGDAAIDALIAARTVGEPPAARAAAAPTAPLAPAAPASS